MAENDIHDLLSRGKLAEPLETEQMEVNSIVDKSKFHRPTKEKIKCKLYKTGFKYRAQVARFKAGIYASSSTLEFWR